MNLDEHRQTIVLLMSAGLRDIDIAETFRVSIAEVRQCIRLLIQEAQPLQPAADYWSRK